jgi:putative aldouronate transport system substrate-binding protein
VEQHKPTFSRRGFLAGALAGTVALPLLNACAPAAAPAPAAPAGGGGAGAPAAGAGKSLFPNFIPFTGGPKPDYHDANPLFADAYDNYPAQPFKANSGGPPGAGGVLNVLVTAYFPSPTGVDLNPTWQSINKQLNADVKMTIIPGADYRPKFATTMASDDLPDIMHIFFGYTVAPNLPAFFKSKCADLTPYLSGDASKEYPYLSAIPTPAWKNSISAIDGALYLIPIHRPMFSIQPRGGNFFKNNEMWDPEIGADYVPKDAADFKKVLQQLNRPNENRYAIGNTGNNDTLFGIGGYAQMFNAPNGWKLDGGKLLRDRETEEYKAAVGYMRDLMASGLFPPDVSNISNSRTELLLTRRIAVSLEGQGNSWVDFWQRGLQANPPMHFSMIKPWPANAGQKAMNFLGTGFVSMNVLKKASADRIKEILRILNWLAAPFGSEEDLLLTYGLEGQDYTKDDKGNPKPTAEGISRAGWVPWRYMAQHPWVYYQAGLDGFPKASYDAEHATIPIGIDDPTNGFYAPTQYSKGAVADLAWNDAIRDIISSRRPFSDYDTVTREWATAAGDQVRKEYMDAIAAAPKS